MIQGKLELVDEHGEKIVLEMTEVRVVRQVSFARYPGTPKLYKLEFVSKDKIQWRK